MSELSHEAVLESSARCLAFRRLVYRISQQLSRDELKTLIYIRLYSSRDAYTDSSALEVLSKLESDGAFTPSRAEGLAELMKEVKRHDLVHDVRDFLKKKWAKKWSAKASIKELALSRCVSDEEMQLRGTLEVALTQAAVLVQQLEGLEMALEKGERQTEKAIDAIEQAEQTASALADRLRRTQVAMGMKCSVYDDGDWGVDDYTQMYAIPRPAESQQVARGGEGEEEYEVMQPSSLEPRSSRECIPKEEAPHYSIPVPKAERERQASRKWVKQAYTQGDQLLPPTPPDTPSPLLAAGAGRPVPPRKPGAAKRPLSLPPKQVTGLEAGCSDAYVVLNLHPTSLGEEPGEQDCTGGGEGGDLHEVRQWHRASMKPKVPVLPKHPHHHNQPRAESHYYKSLNKTADLDSSYTAIKH